MSKKTYPKSNLAANANKSVNQNLDDILYSRPKSEIQEELEKNGDAEEKGSEEDVNNKTENAKKEIPAKGKSLSKILEMEPGLIKKSENTPNAIKPNVRIYFDEQNYSRFEDMFEDLKKQVRQQTGVKLKETGMCELAIMLIVDEFEKDPVKILNKILKSISKK
ncbi:MAG TPA: hypothetical protein PKY82_06150 [Pyrinomonadaceae bacterium]|nr:hypothetical protein [Pyrinomonadaceae bacterium]